MCFIPTTRGGGWDDYISWLWRPLRSEGGGWVVGGGLQLLSTVIMIIIIIIIYETTRVVSLLDDWMDKKTSERDNLTICAFVYLLMAFKDSPLIGIINCFCYWPTFGLHYYRSSLSTWWTDRDSFESFLLVSIRLNPLWTSHSSSSCIIPPRNGKRMGEEELVCSFQLALYVHTI